MTSRPGDRERMEEVGLRIHEICITPMHVPLARPFHAAVSILDSVDPVLVTVSDRDGHQGFGIAFAFGPADARGISALACKLADVLVDETVSGVRAAHERMRRSLEFVGVGGPALAALGAIDLALWDLLSRRAETPLWQMLGGARSAAPAYASCGSLDLSPDELVDEVRSLTDLGHCSIKVKSRGNPGEDCLRLKALRQAFGKDMRIALDANQSLAPKAAIRWARQVEEFDLWWIEEPVRADDHHGHRTVRQAIGCDLASGENLYGTISALDTIRHNAVDILMPNLQRLGGLTPWLTVAAYAQASGVQVGAHVHPEYQVQAMCALPGTVAIECWPGWPWIWEEQIEVRAGLMTPPRGPGIGLTPDLEFIRSHRAEL